MGNAMQEVCGAVNRVNDPAGCILIRGINLTSFFHDKAPVRSSLCQLGLNSAFSGNIRLTDKIS